MGKAEIWEREGGWNGQRKELAGLLLQHGAYFQVHDTYMYSMYLLGYTATKAKPNPNVGSNKQSSQLKMVA